jgi:hypothetical protein
MRGTSPTMLARREVPTKGNISGSFEEDDRGNIRPWGGTSESRIKVLNSREIRFSALPTVG